MNKQRIRLITGLLSACVALQTGSAASGPLKVFILSGQSNMQGQANVSTLGYLGKDEKSAPMLRDILDKDGNPKTCDHVWITYLSSGKGGEQAEKNGKLTTGFGANDACIGPELTFGIYMEKQVRQPILLIKTAWGGKSLNTDFRPPGAGPYEFNASQVEQFKKQGKDLEAQKAAKAKETGVYYRLMMEHVKKVLADPGKYCPEYDAKAGYEIAGFVWFQGWNDMVDGGTYPERDKPGGYAAYSTVLAQFIRDVRSDLNAPKMPFVIGVLGVDGPLDLEHPNRYTPIHKGFRDAMAAPAGMPEFKGTVVSVLTEKYWDPLHTSAEEKKGKIKGQIEKMKKDGRKFGKGEEAELFNKLMAEECTPQELEALKGVSNAAFHYLGSAKIMGGIGKGFAEAMLEMEKKQGAD